jgi:hypothetical protein
MGAQRDGAEGGGPMGQADQGNDERHPPQPRPAPRRSARDVNTMTITVTPEQYAALVSLAEAKGVSLSVIVRQFIDAGLAPQK